MNIAPRPSEKIENRVRAFSLTNVLCTVVVCWSVIFYVRILTENWGEVRFDDAYMFARYAHNIIDGNLFRWNPNGEAVFGATSLLYVLVLALSMKLLSIGQGFLLLLHSWTFGLFALIALVIACSDWAESPLLKNRLFTGAVLLPPLVFQDLFRFHCTTGMDTTFSFCIHGLLIIQFLRYQESPSRKECFILAGIAYLTYLARPDNAVCAIFFPILGFLFPLKDVKRSEAFFFAGVLGTFLAIDTMAKWLLFGHVLPLSAFTKTGGFYFGYIGWHYWNPVTYLKQVFFGLSPFFVLLFMGGSRLMPGLLIPFLLPPIATFAAYFSVQQIMGFAARYYVPFIPYFIVCSWKILDEIVQRKDQLSLRWFANRLIPSLAVFVILSSFPIEEWYADRFLAAKPFPKAKIMMKSRESLPAIDWWEVIGAVSETAARLPKDSLIAASEIGYLAASNPDHPFLDLAGLNDPLIARKGFSVKAILDRKPDLIWFPPADCTGVVHSLLSDPDFFLNYSFYPEAFNYGIAVRNSGVTAETIAKIFRTQWEKNYPKTLMEDHRGFPVR